MGMNSIKIFLEQRINEVEAINLDQTKQNIQVRDNIDLTIFSMRQALNQCLYKQKELEELVSVIKKIKGDKDGNCNFETKQQVKVPVKYDKPKGTYNTVCVECSHTCHKNCAIAKDEDKKWCAAIKNESNCTCCPNKCHWNRHYNLPYYFELET